MLDARQDPAHAHFHHGGHIAFIAPSMPQGQQFLCLFFRSLAETHRLDLLHQVVHTRPLVGVDAAEDSAHLDGQVRKSLGHGWIVAPFLHFERQGAQQRQHQGRVPGPVDQLGFTQRAHHPVGILFIFGNAQPQLELGHGLETWLRIAQGF